MARRILVVDDDKQIVRLVKAYLRERALARRDLSRRVEVGGSQEIEEVGRAQVVDSGGGIGPEDLPRVFDRFWRADRARSRQTGGSGLGLAIARSLVEGQGGEIGVASEQGEGARFWFSLPVWPQPDRRFDVGS